MVRVVADHVSLAYPLYAYARVNEHVSGPRDDRVLLAKDGRIKGVRALDDVSFELAAGDRLAVVGRNGSGKTTLLQVLAGILKPDAGSVLVDGRTTNLININMGMQDEATGQRNVTLRGLAAGRSRREIEERRFDIEEFSELGEFLSMPVSTYSTGMRMRLSFAIATAFHPEILILDEWIGAGDEAFRAKASERMREFVGKAGVLVLASHSRELMQKNCNKALWLDRGKARAFGELAPTLAQYERSVAGAKAEPLPPAAASG